LGGTAVAFWIRGNEASRATVACRGPDGPPARLVLLGSRLKRDGMLARIAVASQPDQASRRHNRQLQRRNPDG